MDALDKRAVLAEREKTLRKVTETATSVARRALEPIRRRLDALERTAKQPAKIGPKGDDGLAFDGLNAELIGERTLKLTFENGERRKEFEFQIPSLIYRGAYRSGESYTRGDMVSLAGSLWHCNFLTSEKPKASKCKDWTLCVRRGRDGANGKDGERGPAGPSGKQGKSATQILTDGSKV